MGEKNEIKVKLSTVVYLFIILVLVVALGAVYYLGFVKNDNANNIFVNEQVTETDNNQKEDEIKENRFKEGKYSYVNAGRKEIMAQDNKFTLVLLETYIEFDNNNFKVYDNDQLFTSGKYEQISDNLIKCVISDERSFEFKIMEKNELEIIKLNSNDAETEFNIRLYDILGEKNEYVLYEENDLVGTWNTTYVYKDMGGGDFWKIEEHQIDEKFTFDNKGTYNKKENSEVSEGTYELEINRIYTSKDSGGMYLIDEDTILYTLGTEYKIILSKNSNNEFEQDLNKYKGKEAISLIAKENTRFVINEIKNNGDTYIINASILEKEPRKILEDEYNDILEGQEVTFRDIKWKYDKSINDEYATYLKSAKDYNNMQATAKLALRSGNTEGVRYFTNIAGVAGDLCDYSDIKVEFEVSKDIKVCSFWGEFEYVNGKLVCRNIDNEDMETTAQTIDTLIEFRNNNEPGTCGTYEECIAYVSNSKVDAIKIFEK